MGHGTQRHLALLGGALVAFAGGLLAPRAGAADDEKIVWSLGDEALRFDLEEDPAQRSAPEPGFAPVFEKTRLLTAIDLDRSRRWKPAIRDVSDVVWFFSFFLPDGEYGPKGGVYPVHESWTLPNGVGDLVANGRDEVKRLPGGKTQLRVTLDLAPDKLPPEPAKGSRIPPPIDKGSTLTVERTYLDKRHQVVEVRFDLTLKRQTTGEGLKVFHHAGKVSLGGRVETSGKAFLVEVQQAIRRGTSFLQERLGKLVSDNAKNKTQAGSQALGHVALPTFALLRSGVPASQLKDAFDFMATCEWREIYSVSLYLMCLEAKTVRREETPPAAGGHSVSRYRKDPPSKPDQAEMLRLARWLAAVRKHGEGWWSYGGNPGRALEVVPGKGTSDKKPGALAPGEEGFPTSHDGKTPSDWGDRSNSQFATLALHAAATCDVPVDPEVWKEIVNELAAAQETSGPAQSLRGVEWSAAAPPGIAPEGGADPFAPRATRTKSALERELGEGATARGWAYSMFRPTNAVAGVRAYGSMTGAGLSSAAIAREALRRAGKLDPDLDAKTRRLIHDGVAWFFQHWTPERNPESNAWYYYYLYSVEKAMETAGVEKLGPREWWREGCAQLLALEDAGKKGSWNGGNLEDTSFALLFLNRATLPATIVTQDQIKVASGERDPEAWDQVFVEGTGHVRVRQVLYALETATGELVKERLKVAEKAFELLDEDQRPRVVPDLLRVAAGAAKDVRRFALKALRAATGTEDEARARIQHARWLEVVAASAERDYAAIPKLRALLRDAESLTPLKRSIALAAARLHAVEATGDLVAELADKDVSYRRVVATALVNLAGGERVKFDPAAPDSDRTAQLGGWLEWWRKNQSALVMDEEVRRLVEDLGGTDALVADVAVERLRKLGKRAVRGLVDGLIHPLAKPRAHGLLKELTGQKLPAETAPWLEWWEKNLKGG